MECLPVYVPCVLASCSLSHNLQLMYYLLHNAQETVSSEKLGNLPKITQLVNSRASLSRRACALPVILWVLWKGNLLCGQRSHPTDL